MITNLDPYKIKSVSDIDSPALLVFPKVVEENIDIALKMISNSSKTFLRPHIKTVKCVEIAQMAIAKGIDRFKCSTISEAELLGIAKAKDVLLSYQLSNTKAKRFSRLRQKFPETQFSALVDNFESAHMLSELFKKDPLNVFIDLNVGMDRTGVKTEQAFELITQTDNLNGISIKGLHAYDGHVHASDFKIRKDQTNNILKDVANLKYKVEKYLNRKMIVVIGGSPSFPFYAKQEEVECSPGTFFLWDEGYGSSFSEMSFTPAALILTRVISIIDKTTLCFDLGTKATASDPPLPRVKILGLENGVVINQFEEHLIVNVPDTSLFHIGEPFLAIPVHVCPTVNLYEELVVIKNQVVFDYWPVKARNRKITV
ncbi:D-TA family PLP-dependent enzyme [Kriegella sp. EG-1]|nr:D-TA family PLP-dependent enzyme [Flavobacteriaceae bacterium EG-1]